jgi:phosphomannomutase
MEKKVDKINPAHYCSHPSGVDCIEITRHHNFNVGNAIKYLWRNGVKLNETGDSRLSSIEDLKKAAWYIADEIRELERQTKIDQYE